MHKIDNDFQFHIRRMESTKVEATENSTFTKALAAVTLTAMLLAVLLAGIFIAVEADHDCEGEDCHICQCLEQCKTTLRQLGEVCSAAKVSVFTAAVLLTTCFHFVRVILRETPVTIKVRLND